MIIQLIVFYLTFVPNVESAESQYLVDNLKNRIVDKSGRERYFHGTNVVYKTDPFIPITTHFDSRYSFSEEDAFLMASMGYSTIRLGVLWAGMEPSEGEYNQTYMDKVSEIIDLAGRYGLHTVLDMHQDVFNRKYCGNGVPDWVAQPDKENFPYPLEVEYDVDENLYPSREDCGKIAWPNYHFTTSLSQSVGRLYNNFRGLLDKFARFWGKVAETFADNRYVLGYEIMNEPWCGDVYEDPTLLIPGVSDRKYLQPMYDRVNAEIRKYDDAHIILFESVTWEIVGIGEALGFTHPPGGNEYRNRSVLSFHNSVQPQVTPDDQYYDLRLGEIKRLGIAGFVTETGDAQLSLMDDIVRWGYSWHHWAYKLYGDWTWDSAGLFFRDCHGGMDECLNRNRTVEFARVYPMAVAGSSKYFHFDTSTNEAILVYQPDAENLVPTVIKVPVIWRYENGFTVEILPSDVATWTQGCCDVVANTTVEISTSEQWNGEELSVMVHPMN